MSELKAKLNASTEQNRALKRHADDVENNARQLQNQLLSVKGERDDS